MKPETKQRIEDAIIDTRMFLIDHPVIRGMLVGFMAGVLAGAWAF